MACRIRKSLMNHVWRPLVEKAGYKIEDIPKTWNAYYDFFGEVQKKLRAQGMRKIYGIGLTMSTTGNDTNNQFNYFLNAYGGRDIVTPDGKLNADDPQVREAVIKALEYPTSLYKEGVIPPSAISWNDSDNNNAFHSKVIVMDLDGTISTEVAIMKSHPKDYDDIETMGLALDNNGKPIASSGEQRLRLDPERGKKRRGRQGFPEICDPAGSAQRMAESRPRPEHAADGVGRQRRSVVVRGPAPQGLCQFGLFGPTLPDFFTYNPAWAHVRNAHVWGTRGPTSS